MNYSSKDLLNSICSTRRLIDLKKRQLEALYDDTFGIHIKCSYDDDRVQTSNTSPDAKLISSLERYHKYAEKTDLEIQQHINYINRIDDMLVELKDPKLELIVRMRFFNGTTKMPKRQIARSLCYSENSIDQYLSDAYYILDQCIVDPKYKDLF